MKDVPASELKEGDVIQRRGLTCKVVKAERVEVTVILTLKPLEDQFTSRELYNQNIRVFNRK